MQLFTAFFLINIIEKLKIFNQKQANDFEIEVFDMWWDVDMKVLILHTRLKKALLLCHTRDFDCKSRRMPSPLKRYKNSLPCKVTTFKQVSCNQRPCFLVREIGRKKVTILLRYMIFVCYFKTIDWMKMNRWTHQKLKKIFTTWMKKFISAVLQVYLTLYWVLLTKS